MIKQDLPEGLETLKRRRRKKFLAHSVEHINLKFSIDA